MSSALQGGGAGVDFPSRWARNQDFRRARKHVRPVPKDRSLDKYDLAISSDAMDVICEIISVKDERVFYFGIGRIETLNEKFAEDLSTLESCVSILKPQESRLFLRTKGGITSRTTRYWSLETLREYKIRGIEEDLRECGSLEGGLAIIRKKIESIEEDIRDLGTCIKFYTKELEKKDDLG